MKSLQTIIYLCIIFTQVFSQFNYQTDITKNLEEYSTNLKLNFTVHTGYIPVKFEDSTSAIFYEFFTKQGEKLENMNDDTPVIIWFSGGPGCSSQYASWGEMGPIITNSTGGLDIREFAWNQNATLIFIDQPLNTGFSYTDHKTQVNNTYLAGDHLIQFLNGFYALDQYKDLAKNPTYFFGESYAGHYIPEFSFLVTQKKTNFTLNFKGMGIGNGIASQASRENISKIQVTVQRAYEIQDYLNAEKLMDTITDDTITYGNINAFNFMEYSSDDDYSEQLLNQTHFATEVYGISKQDKEKIDQQNKGFVGCNDEVFQAFLVDSANSFIDRVEKLLKLEDFKILIYNGNIDMVCNTVGVEQWINSMEWDNLQKWQQQEKKVMYMDKKLIGNYKNYGNFTYVGNNFFFQITKQIKQIFIFLILTFAVVYDSGHMVPTNQAEAAHFLISNFINQN